MKWVIVLITFITLVSCEKEEADTRPVYALAPYEVIDQLLVVKDTDTTYAAVAMTPTQDSVGYRARINQLPDYLSRTTIRSFKRLDDSSLEVSIRLDTLRFAVPDTVVYLSNGTIPELPNYIYDQVEDYIYQCNGNSRTSRGPNSAIFPSITNWNCATSTVESQAEVAISALSKLDSLLLTRLALPYRR